MDRLKRPLDILNCSSFRIFPRDRFKRTNLPYRIMTLLDLKIEIESIVNIKE